LNTSTTANTTQTAAKAVWHMLQGFLGAFPQYIPSNISPTTVGVNLFVESYGGKYGPAFASLFQKQNAARLNGTISQNLTIPIKLVSLGIINGCVDDLIQAPFYPVMAVNNTYGITVINPTRANLANASFYAPGGCRDVIMQCRAGVLSQDPKDIGNVTSVNALCLSAYTSCTENVMSPYGDAGRSFYDIAHLSPDPFPPSTFLEYLNTDTFLTAIGSPVNYTQTSFQVLSAFTATGDYERDSLVSELATLLNSGVRVGLIYGDRDYICNWFGGEAISLKVAMSASGTYFQRFSTAGYAPIIVNSSYIGGVVRQYGNLSFSRIYDAGHAVPAYQPETAFQVFSRIISGTSVSTGEIIDLRSYNTSGPQSASQTNSLPASPAATCWLRNIPNTCTNDQKNLILKSQGVIINGVLYNKENDWPLAAMSSSSADSGMPVASGITTTVTQILTGAYTASATPSTKSESMPRRNMGKVLFLVVAIMSLQFLIC
jgi:carboxypeptidase C (cathepsin A)